MIAVFTGPSLDAARARALLPEAEVREPAVRGDIYWLAEAGARVIVLIDGYFEHNLSVWHKELLWALSRGVAVYGGASMGALRAAELRGFGMVGVGEIYERFVRGDLEDDDEVAVVHESSERGFRALADAMINIRCTLEVAVAQGLLEPAHQARLVEIAKATFYPQRSLRAVLETAARQGVPEPAITALRAWVQGRGGLVDQKRADAEALLSRVRADLERGLSELPRPAFVYTEAFRQFELEVRSMARKTGAGSPRIRGALHGHPAPAEPHASEVACEPGPQAPSAPDRGPSDVAGAASCEARLAAAERAVGLLLAEQRGLLSAGPEVQAYSERFRAARGLYSPEQTAAFLAAHDVTLEEFSRLMYEESALERVGPVRAAVLATHEHTLRALERLNGALKR